MRLARRALLAAGLALTIAMALMPSTAQAQPSPDNPPVTIIKVSGLLDPVLADFVERSIAAAEREANLTLVLQVNSGGSVLSQARFERLAERIRDSRIPIAAWVGPSGAKAKGRTAQLLELTDRVGIAPRSRIGATGNDALADDRFPKRWDLATTSRLVNETVGFDEAENLGVALKAPVIGDFLIDLPGFRTEVEGTGADARRKPVTPVTFSSLSIVANQFHTVASPAVAYLLFLVGLGLLIFEFYTGGVGIAGVIGAGAFVLGCFGLDVLPARWWAVGLLVFAMFGFAIDVQVGVPRVWTGIGTACLLVGSLLLYDGHSVPWLTLVVGVLGVVAAMVQGMPSMVRTRFSTPTIGREWMLGEEGVAETAVSPDGVVRVRNALWRARTNRATPVAKGGAIRVVAIDALLLEVEPAEGGARDYRERARKPGDDAPETTERGENARE